MSDEQTQGTIDDLVEAWSTICEIMENALEKIVQVFKRCVYIIARFLIWFVLRVDLGCSDCFARFVSTKTPDAFLFRVYEVIS